MVTKHGCSILIRSSYLSLQRWKWKLYKLQTDKYMRGNKYEVVKEAFTEYSTNSRATRPSIWAWLLIPHRIMCIVFSAHYSTNYKSRCGPISPWCWHRLYTRLFPGECWWHKESSVYHQVALRSTPRHCRSWTSPPASLREFLGRQIGGNLLR